MSWVFTNLDTGTVEGADYGSYLVPVERLTDDERQVLDDASDFGSFTDEACEIVARVGVPVLALIELWENHRARAVVS
jgi:hypothetical protein